MESGLSVFPFMNCAFVAKPKNPVIFIYIFFFFFFFKMCLFILEGECTWREGQKEREDPH